MVLKKLLSSAARAKLPPCRVPDGERIYAIGDIHGRLDLLDALIADIDRDDAARGEKKTLFVFLGDLVDRGPDSRGVVERLMALKAAGRRTRCLMGNHEEVFLRAAGGDVKALRFLLRIGGGSTVLSYGISEDEYRASDFEELARLLAERVPPAHLAFLSSFEDLIEIGDYMFVHAGIRPGVAPDAQRASDLRWIRGDFLDHRQPHCKLVIHGHSISDGVDIRRNRIGIDTGAYESGRLTAIGLEGGDRWFLST